MTLSSHNLTRSLSRGALALSGAICLSWACSATHPSDSTVRQRARPLSASTLVSGELDVAPYVASLIESANGLDVAKGVDSHLVVWSNSHSYNANGYEVYGARVALDGTLLDPVAFVVSSAEGRQDVPKVEFNGTDWLVAWRDDRNGNNDVYATRVSQSGQVLDPKGIPIATSSSTETFIDVSSDGNGFFLTYRLGGIQGVLVNADGSVNPTVVPVSDAPDGGGWVAFNGSHYLVVAQRGGSGQSNTLEAVRVTPQGTVEPGVEQLVTAGSTQTIYGNCLASGGGAWLLSYSVGPTSSVSRSHAVVAIDAQGKRVASPATLLSTTGYSVNDVAWGAGAYTLLISSSSSELRRAYRISAGGSSLSYEQPYTGVTLGSYARLSFDGTNFFLVHQANRKFGNVRGMGNLLTPENVLVHEEDFEFAYQANPLQAPAVAFNGSHYLVAYQDGHLERDENIAATLLAPDGTAVDPAGFTVSGALNNQEKPAVASNGKDFLVAWTDDRAKLTYPLRDLMYSVIRADGTVVHPTGANLGPILNIQVGLASTGDGYLVVAMVDGQHELFLVSNDGDSSSKLGFTIPGGAGKVAASDSRYLVAYQDNNDIFGVLVDEDGTLLTTGSPITISAISGVTEQLPLVASDGTDFLVAWQTGTSSYDISAARVQADGTVLDVLPIELGPTAGTQLHHSVAWDGASYIVGWRDDGFGELPEGYYANGITKQGALVLTDPLSIVQSPHDIYQPAMVGVPALGQALFVHDIFDGSEGVHARRVKARFLSDDSIVIGDGDGDAPGDGDSSAGDGDTSAGDGDSVGDGDGDSSGDGDASGDGDSAGDGDASGDGDSAGDGDASGDGDSVGDGDGDSSGDGDAAGGGDGDKNSEACVPGIQQSCACPGTSAEGVQVCADDGDRFESCQCPGDVEWATVQEEGGCGCRFQGSPPPSKAPWFVLAAAGVFFLRRRSRESV